MELIVDRLVKRLPAVTRELKGIGRLEECPYQSGPTRPSRVMIIWKGFKSNFRWSVYDLKLSQKTFWTGQRFPATLQTAWGRLSWAVNWPLLVTAVPVLQRQWSQLCPATVTAVPVLQTREIVTLCMLYLYICCLTGTEMLMKEITQYRDPFIWRIKALVHPAIQTALCSGDAVCFCMKLQYIQGCLYTAVYRMWICALAPLIA